MAPPPLTPLAGVALLLSLALFLHAGAQGAKVGLAAGGLRSTRTLSSSSSSPGSYVPVRTVVYRSSALLPAATSAEAYEPFQLCRECRCCPPAGSGGGGNSSSCVDTRCCYAIDCNIPGKPFGTCAFTPRTCGCGATNNCTKPAA